MKITSEKIIKGGRRLVVELNANETLISIRSNSHYRIGEPVREVMASHIIEDCTEVSWCSVSQKWVE